MGMLLFRRTMSARWSLLLMLENLLSCAPHIASGIQLYAESAPRGTRNPRVSTEAWFTSQLGKIEALGPGLAPRGVKWRNDGWNCAPKPLDSHQVLHLLWRSPVIFDFDKMSCGEWSVATVAWTFGVHNTLPLGFKHSLFGPQKPRAWIFIKIFFSQDSMWDSFFHEIKFLEAIEPAGCIYHKPHSSPTNINRLNYLHGGHHLVELLGHPVVSWFMNPIAYSCKYNEH